MNTSGRDEARCNTDMRRLPRKIRGGVVLSTPTIRRLGGCELIVNSGVIVIRIVHRCFVITAIRVDVGRVVGGARAQGRRRGRGLRRLWRRCWMHVIKSGSRGGIVDPGAVATRELVVVEGVHIV